MTGSHLFFQAGENQLVDEKSSFILRFHFLFDPGQPDVCINKLILLRLCCFPPKTPRFALVILAAGWYANAILYVQSWRFLNKTRFAFADRLFLSEQLVNWP